MKILAGIGALGMLGGGLYATDALTAGTVYDKPYEQAYAELAEMPLLPATGTSVDGSGSITVERGAGADQLADFAWHGRGRPLYRAANQVGAHERSCAGGVRRATPMVDGPNAILQSELMTEFARLAMVEQVEARMENRPPDLREVHLAAARHIQAHPEQVKAFATAVEGQFAQVDQMLRADQSDEESGPRS